MKTEQEYAEMLIEQYEDAEFFAVQFAIKDVTNTITALQEVDRLGHIDSDHFDYYNNVLNILKEKV
jgi:hypothetical protein